MDLVGNDMNTFTGGATARPPRAAGRARRRRSKGKKIYIKIKLCNFLVKYFA